MPDDTVLLERHFDTAFAAPDGIQKLRELILTLAMQGKLVPQDPKDQPASELLKEIEVEKQRLLKKGKIKQPKPLPAIQAEEVSYSIPQGWEWVRLGNIGEINPRNTFDDDTDTGFVPMPLIFSEYGSIHKFQTRKWSEIKKGYTHFADGDVALAKITPCFENGKSCVFKNLPNGIGAGTTELHIFRNTFNAIHPEYLLAYFKNPKYIASGTLKMTGSAGQKRVPTEFFTLNPFPLPPLAEQRRIVTKIDRLMARCDELEKLRAERNQKRITVHTAALDRLLNAKESDNFSTAWHFITQHFGELYSVKEDVAELRKAILQLAVMGKLVPQDPTDEPASELLRAIAAKKQRLVKEKKLKIGQLTNDSKSTNANIAIPSSWSWVKGIDLFFITKLAGFEYTEHIILLDIGEVPVIRAQNVKPFKLNVDNLKYIDLNTSKLLERCSLTKAALLVTFIGAGIGDVALFDFQERWHLAPNVAKMEPFSGCENKVNLKYIAYFLNSSVGRNEIFKHLKSTAQPSISMGTIRDIDYPLPPLPEQHRIVTKIDQLMALCNHLDQQIDAATGKQSALLNAVMAQV